MILCLIATLSLLFFAAFSSPGSHDQEESQTQAPEPFATAEEDLWTQVYESLDSDVLSLEELGRAEENALKEPQDSSVTFGKR